LIWVKFAGESALPPKADIDRRYGIVRFVPKADICGAAVAAYSITSSARAPVNFAAIGSAAI